MYSYTHTYAHTYWSRVLGTHSYNYSQLAHLRKHLMVKHVRCTLAHFHTSTHTHTYLLVKRVRYTLTHSRTRTYTLTPTHTYCSSV